MRNISNIKFDRIPSRITTIYLSIYLSSDLDEIVLPSRITKLIISIHNNDYNIPLYLNSDYKIFKNLKNLVNFMSLNKVDNLINFDVTKFPKLKKLQLPGIISYDGYDKYENIYRQLEVLNLGKFTHG
jgi:hypothetical protein